MENTHENYPANRLFEEVLLSSIIYAIDDETRVEMIDNLNTENFFYPALKTIGNIIIELHKSSMPIHEDFIVNTLKKMEVYDEAVLFEVLGANSLPSFTSFKHYLDEIADLSSKRGLINLSRSLLTVENVSDSIAKTRDGLKHIEDGLGFSEFITLEDALKDYKESGVDKPRYLTGISQIDDVLGGLELGQLIAVGGKKESGKTVLTTQILENVSEGFKTAFFSFEFTVDMYAKRKLIAPVKNPQNMYIISDGYDISDIEKTVRKLHKEGVNFFVIDSMLRVKNRNGNSKEERISDMFSRLALLCHGLNIIIFIIVQSSKGDHSNSERSIKGSIDADHEINQFWFIEVNEDGSRMLEFAKNKQNGRHPVMQMGFNEEKVRFENYQISAGMVIDYEENYDMPDFTT